VLVALASCSERSADLRANIERPSIFAESELQRASQTTVVWIARDTDCQSCENPLAAIRRLVGEQAETKLTVLVVGDSLRSFRGLLDQYDLDGEVRKPTLTEVAVVKGSTPGVFLRRGTSEAQWWTRSSRPSYAELCRSSFD